MKRLPKIPENWLDKTISYISPQTGLRRLEARTRLAIAGGYTGARRDRRQTSNWNVARTSNIPCQFKS